MKIWYCFYKEYQNDRDEDDRFKFDSKDIWIFNEFWE